MIALAGVLVAVSALVPIRAGAETRPGTLIELRASCAGSSSDGSAVVYIAVRSPASVAAGTAVYLAQGRTRTVQRKEGGIVTFTEHNANGWIVRFLHRYAGGGYLVLEGIQLRDGRVLVDGAPVERQDK